MILAVDLGKTVCRAPAAGRRAVGTGTPGLAVPGVDAAEAAVRLDRARGRVRDALGELAGPDGQPIRPAEHW
jgi:N-acetylmuramic acid 6-phosphate etherase